VQAFVPSEAENQTLNRHNKVRKRKSSTKAGEIE
jgi:hypothetical protein